MCLSCDWPENAEGGGLFDCRTAEQRPGQSSAALYEVAAGEVHQLARDNQWRHEFFNKDKRR